MAHRARPVFAFGLAMACASIAHAQKTQLISLNGQGLPSQFVSSQAAISGDGKFVAFVSSGNDIVANDNNQTSDVFLRDVERGKGSATLVFLAKLAAALDTTIEKLTHGV